MDDPRFRHISSPHNSGNQAKPNHRAVGEARGEWIAYLGHDDLWMPWHLDTLLAAAKRHNADFVHALVLAVRPDGTVDVFGPPSTATDVFLSEWVVPPSGWLHRKEVLARGGGWRDDGKALRPIDADLLERIVASGTRVACSDTASVVKFISDDYSAYGPAAVRPQASHFSRMSSDARALERDLLTRAARDFARLKFSGRPRPAAAARMLVRSLAYRVKELTRYTPVLSWVWQRHYAVLRRRRTKRRGLLA